MNRYDMGWEFEHVDVKQTVEIPQWEMSLIDVISQSVLAGKDSPWGAKIGGSIGSKPVVQDGVVYFGANDYIFYAVDVNTGKELWRFRTGGIVSAWSAAAIKGDRIFFTCYDGNVYCLSIEGKLLWKYGAGDRLACAPLLVEGMVIFGSRDKNLYAVSAESGREIWKVSIGREIASHPMHHEGFIYVGSARGVHKISLAGRVEWSRPVTGEVNSRIAAIGDRIYFGSFDGNIYCYSTSGRRIWRFSARGPFVSDAVIMDRNIILGSYDHNYYCLDESGRLVWKFMVDDIAYTCFTSGNRVYLPSFRNRLYCLSQKGKLIWEKRVKELVHGFANKDVIIAATWECKIHAFTTEGKGLWEFQTSMSQPSEVEFDSPEDMIFEVVHTVGNPVKKQGKPQEKEFGSYGDFRGQYIGEDMRDYIGSEVKDQVPGMRYRIGKKVYR